MRSLSLLVTILCLSSCSLLTPKVDAKKLAEVESLAKREAFQRVKKLNATKGEGLRLRGGQWVKRLVRYKDNSDMILVTTQIIHATHKEVILEVSSVSASQDGKATHGQIAFENFPRRVLLKASSSEIEKVLKNVKVTRSLTKSSDGIVHEAPAAALMMSGNLAQSYVKSVPQNSALRQKCSSQWIQSTNCWDYEISASFMGMNHKSQVWSHSSIPIDGLLRMEDENTITETIAYGLTGAKTLF